MTSLASLRTLGVRLGANMLHYSGSLTMLQRYYRQRKAFSGKARIESQPFLILLYHRVNPHNDPLFPAVSLSVFDEQARYFARNFRVLRLTEIIRRVESGYPLEPFTLAITFDDGYLDNYTFAHPILKKYDLPATLFVATGYIGTGMMMWNDRLALAIKTAIRQKVAWRAGIREFLLPIGTLEEKVRSFTTVLKELKVLPERDKVIALQDLLDTLESGRTDIPRVMLEWEHLHRMAESGWEIGSHTVNHPILTRVESSRAVLELRESKRQIEYQIQMPVSLCAFPNGKRSDFNAHIKSLTRDLGYRAAVTTLRGINECHSDLFELRRSSIWETSLPTLACKLFLMYQGASHGDGDYSETDGDLGPLQVA